MNFEIIKKMILYIEVKRERELVEKQQDNKQDYFIFLLEEVRRNRIYNA